MNSLTHSCMHSLASFAIFAFSGRAVFMIRATATQVIKLARNELEDDGLMLVKRYKTEGAGNTLCD